MQTFRMILGVFVVLLAACGGDKTNDANGVADLLLINGDVVTVDDTIPQAEAVAIAGDRILAVGTTDEMLRYRGDDTEVVDVGGQMVIPGFIEGHGHYTSFGGSLLILDFRYAKSFAEIVSMVAAAAAETPAGEWVVGRGWHQDKWETREDKLVEGLPVHDSLSAATPDHPVMLIHTSGHAVFVNQRAMTQVELDGSTVPPEGGEIVLDENGDPTGMMREAAQDIFRVAYSGHQGRRPAGVAEAELRRMITLAGEESLRHGITSFQDLGSTFAEVDLLKVMADEGNLPVRLYMSFEEQAADMAGRLGDYRMVGYGNNFLTVRTIGEKVLDGALGTHGGWLLEPYADMPRSHGLNVVPIEEIEASAELAMKHDYQMAIAPTANCSISMKPSSQSTRTGRTCAGASSMPRSYIPTTWRARSSSASFLPYRAFSRARTDHGSRNASARNARKNVVTYSIRSPKPDSSRPTAPTHRLTRSARSAVFIAPSRDVCRTARCSSRKKPIRATARCIRTRWATRLPRSKKISRARSRRASLPTSRCCHKTC